MSQSKMYEKVIEWKGKKYQIGMFFKKKSESPNPGYYLSAMLVVGQGQSNPILSVFDSKFIILLPCDRRSKARQQEAEALIEAKTPELMAKFQKA